MTGRVFTAAAPMRLDFAGGWTDVPPFSEREGGLVVNAAIALSAHARLELAGAVTRLISEDQGVSAVADGAGPVDRRLALLEAALRGRRERSACTLTTHSEAPPGSGLGSSGALDVALMAVIAAEEGELPGPEELAHRGWHLEAVDAGIPGGKQDQLAAALGGFNQLSFTDPHVEVQPLRLDPEFRDTLASVTLMCYTGTSRISGDTIARVADGYRRGDRRIVGALRELKAIAAQMAEALCAADLAATGRLLSANWRCQRDLDPAMATPAMDRLESLMREARALGGKASGAGAGGCMFFLFPDAVSARRAARAVPQTGGTLLPLRWAARGVRVTPGRT